MKRQESPHEDSRHNQRMENSRYLLEPEEFEAFKNLSPVLRECYWLLAGDTRYLKPVQFGYQADKRFFDRINWSTQYYVRKRPHDNRFDQEVKVTLLNTKLLIIKSITDNVVRLNDWEKLGWKAYESMKDAIEFIKHEISYPILVSLADSKVEEAEAFCRSRIELWTTDTEFLTKRYVHDFITWSPELPHGLPTHLQEVFDVRKSLLEMVENCQKEKEKLERYRSELKERFHKDIETTIDEKNLPYLSNEILKSLLLKRAGKNCIRSQEETQSDFKLLIYHMRNELFTLLGELSWANLLDPRWFEIDEPFIFKS